MADVQAGSNATPSESEPVADIELGEPQQDEPATASPIAETSKPNESTSAEATSTSVENGKGESTNSSNGKRSSQQQDPEDKDKSLPPSKRTRTAPGGAQRRLFGVLTKTLSKFQEETKKDTEASKRRAELEERLAAKRKEEQEAIDARTGHERTIRNLRFDIIKKEDEKNAFTAIYKARRASKLSLANFLCTKSGSDSNKGEGPSSAAALGSLKPAPLPGLPHAIPPSSTHSSSSTKALYYLPYKLLPWQADQIDGQIEDMRADLEKEETAWKEELAKREAEITELKAKRTELTGGNDTLNDSSARRRSSRKEDDEELPADSSLAGRAPLPEREGSDELSGDARAASHEPSREKEDSTMTPADGDDRLEY